MGLDDALSGPVGCRFLSVFLKSNEASLKSQQFPLLVMQTNDKYAYLVSAVSIFDDALLCLAV